MTCTRVSRVSLDIQTNDLDIFSGFYSGENVNDILGCSSDSLFCLYRFISSEEIGINIDSSVVAPQYLYENDQERRERSLL